ncbi:MAG: HRDC domain-containing protein [Planctomycetota bacterium]
MCEQTPYYYIENDSQIRSLAADMQGAERIALDTEADSLHHYFEKTCLIQLSMNGRNYIVDPLAKIDISSFLSALSQKTLIFHAADYDLRMLRSTFGFRPCGEIIDTMLAARLAGDEHVSLVALVEKYVGIMLSKKGRTSDWSRRPLTAEQLQYAVDDTRYLELLAERLLGKLKEMDRLTWYQQSVCAVVDATGSERASVCREDQWRIRGSSKLGPRQMELVRRIWLWRESEAQAADLPPFKIMDNYLIIKLALWADSNGRGSFSRNGPKLPRHCKGERLKKLKEAVAAAWNTQPDELPKRRKSHPPSLVSRRLTKALKDRCEQIADQVGLPPGLIASRANLEVIAQVRPATLEQAIECSSLLAWQAELVYPVVRDVLSEFDLSADA